MCKWIGHTHFPFQEELNKLQAWLDFKDDAYSYSYYVRFCKIITLNKSHAIMLIFFKFKMKLLVGSNHFRIDAINCCVIFCIAISITKHSNTKLRARTATRTDTRIHSYTHTQTHTHTNTRTLTNTHSNTRAHTRMHTRACIHTL